MHAANQGWCSLNRVSPGAALELGAEGMAEVGLEDSLTARSRAAILSAMASRAVPSPPPAVVGGSHTCQPRESRSLDRLAEIPGF